MQALFTTSRTALKSHFQPQSLPRIISRTYAMSERSIPQVRSIIPCSSETHTCLILLQFEANSWTDRWLCSSTTNPSSSKNAMSTVNGSKQNLGKHSKSQVLLSYKTLPNIGLTYTIHKDPSNGKVIGTCPEFTKADTENAIKSAATAFPSFRKTTGRERARMLRKWYQLIIDNAEDLAKLITWENGKPLADARGEVAYAAGFFEWFSEEAPRNYGDTIEASIPGNRVFTIKEPVGVCGLITP